jgi:hypothetical protein
MSVLIIIVEGALRPRVLWSHYFDMLQADSAWVTQHAAHFHVADNVHVSRLFFCMILVTHQQLNDELKLEHRRRTQ